jgi:hypothetical protein
LRLRSVSSMVMRPAASGDGDGIVGAVRSGVTQRKVFTINAEKNG